MTTLSDQESSGTSGIVKPNRKVWKRGHARGSAPLRVVQDETAAESSVSESGTRVAWDRVCTLSHRAWGTTQRVGRRIHTSDPYTGAPASIRDVVAYTRKGGWIGGDHGRLAESPGYAYGVVVAIPVTMILHALCWTLQKMGRVASVALIVGLLRLAHVDVVGAVTAKWWWLPLWLWIYIGLVAISCALVFPLPKRET